MQNVVILGIEEEYRIGENKALRILLVLVKVRN